VREKLIVWVGVGRGTSNGWSSGSTRTTGTHDGHLKDCVTSSSSKTRQGLKRSETSFEEEIKTNPNMYHVKGDMDFPSSAK
jgi:hypothetical protein